MIKEFKWKFPSYEKNLIPKDGELIEWLSIMQHFGAPTRLLDFSQSMYVALFMAMDNSFYENFSIWCINKNELIFPISQKYIKENQPYDALTTRAFYRAKGERDLAKQILQMIEDEKAPKDETKYFGPLLKDRMFFKCQNKDCTAYDENKENK